jgi:hypothetical protein
MGTGKVPAGLVWILTLVISQGQRAISAKTSAEAEPANQMAPLYLVAGLFTGEVHVGIFEDLIETVLEGTLEGVANQGGSEALPSTRDTLLGDDGSETGDETLVLGGVDL